MEQVPNQNRADRSQRPLPRHVGIIMDGNGRWAQRRGLPRSAGHKEGAKNFKRIAKYCNRIGIQYLTVYAFSTENWKRPALEIKALMLLFKQYLKEALDEFEEENIQIRFLGDTSVFSSDLQELIRQTQEAAKKQTGMVLNIAMNYGGRAELVSAVKAICAKVTSGELEQNEIDEATISQYLDTAGQPDPDLIIRPSGEYRTSNFLLWQSAYAEYLFMDILWPDFTPENLEEALDAYAHRNRRFGGVTPV
ncbi:MAG: isoprenyl transferase [Oscillospiraceae bacterium]|nr:isoprenyl transferase [Oscillospiraceae bacterium]